MYNRYGDEYHFQRIGPNTFTLVGDLKYWRYGGKPNTDNIDYNDLGFVDPSGGPYISEGYTIEGHKVTRISIVNEQIQFEVE